jgi:hypothetical protein
MRWLLSLGGMYRHNDTEHTFRRPTRDANVAAAARSAAGV